MNLFKLFDVIDVRFADLLDIFLVSIVAYYVFLLFRGTRAVQMFIGGGLLLIVWFLAQWWELHTVVWILSNLATLGIIAIVILFQPEIRGALTRIGQSAARMNLKTLFFHQSGLDKVAGEISTAVQDLSKNQFGALIVLENRVGLRNYADTGEILNARISSRLLRALFFPNSALHDGAVILNSHSIVAAGCILPLTQNTDISSELGTRHRAAIGLSECSDATVVVVSEETGNISIARNGRLTRNYTKDTLRAELEKILIRPEPETDRRIFVRSNRKKGNADE